MNLGHPVGKALFRCISALRYYQVRGGADAGTLGKLEDRLRQALADSSECSKLWDDFVASKLLPGFEPPQALKNEDFIPAPENEDLMSEALSPGSFKDGHKLLPVVPRFYG